MADKNMAIVPGTANTSIVVPIFEPADIANRAIQHPIKNDPLDPAKISPSHLSKPFFMIILHIHIVS